MGAPKISIGGGAPSMPPGRPASLGPPTAPAGQRLGSATGLSSRSIPSAANGAVGTSPIAPRSNALHALRTAAGGIGKALLPSAAFVGLSAGTAVTMSDVVKQHRAIAQAMPARFASSSAAPSESVNQAKGALAALHDPAAGREAADQQQERLISSALGFAAQADPVDVAELSSQLRAVFNRLGAGPGAAPDALGASLVAQTAAHLFGPAVDSDVRVAIEAVHGLANATPSKLIDEIASALVSPQSSLDPTLRLTRALASQPGGQERLSRLMGDGTGPSAQGEALAVGLSALLTATQLGPQLGEEQRSFLQAAVSHAALKAGAAPRTDVSDPALRDGHIAFQAVRNGLVDRGEGSHYQQANQWLDKVSSEWLDRTATRNTRVAKHFYGGAMNAASALVPGHFGKTIPFRKTALLEASRAAANAGLLPKPAVALQSLDRAAGEVLNTFKAQAAQRAAGGPPPPLPQQALEGLLTATLQLSLLGHNPVIQALPEKTPRDALPGTDLGGMHMVSVRMAITDTEFDSLGPQFADEWQKLSKSKPNTAHVLGMLSEHLAAQRAATSGPAGNTAPTILERGERSDALAQNAVKGLGEMARRAGTFAASPAGTAAREVAQLATETHALLGSLQPAWRLNSLQPGQLDAIEARMGKNFAALPVEVQKNWAQLKAKSPTAGEVAALIHTALQTAVPPKTTATSTAEGKALRQALDVARGPLEASVNDTRMRRFDESVADMTTTWGDLRAPRDLAAMMESATRRMDLNSHMAMVDQRGSGLNASALLNKVPVPFFDVIAEGFKQMDRTLDIRAQGHSLEMFIGQSDGSNVKAGLRLNATKLDPVSTALSALPGVSVELSAGSEHARQAGQGAGVTLRVEGQGDPEALRRQFGAVLGDLAQASSIVGKDKAYADVLGMLLNRHENLSVSNASTDTRSHVGKTSARAGATLAATDFIPDPTGVLASKLPSVSLAGELSSHSKRGSASRADSTGALQVKEFRLTARHNIDATVEPQGSSFTKGLYKSGGEHTLRTVSRDGAVLPTSTRSTQHFSNHKDFAKAVEADRGAWVRMLAARDTAPHRSDAEKLTAAEARLSELLAASKENNKVKAVGSSRVEGEFQMVRELRPEAAKVWNDVEAHAQLQQSQGNPSAAQTLRALIGDLANDPRNWAPSDLLGGQRGGSAATLANPGLQMRQATGSGGATHMAQRLTAEPS